MSSYCYYTKALSFQRREKEKEFFWDYSSLFYECKNMTQRLLNLCPAPCAMEEEADGSEKFWTFYCVLLSTSCFLCLLRPEAQHGWGRGFFLASSTVLSSENWKEPITSSIHMNFILSQREIEAILFTW